MKNFKKHILVLALILVLPLVLLTGCISGEVKHEASNKWAHDTDFHWHACACGKSDCNETYDLAAHTWIDGTTVETATKTTTNQRCTCGATNEKITQTQEQMFQVYKIVYNGMFDTNLTVTLTSNNMGETKTQVQSFNAETKGFVAYIPGDDNVFSAIVEVDGGYKWYNLYSGEKTYSFYAENEHPIYNEAGDITEETLLDFISENDYVSVTFTKIDDTYKCVITTYDSINTINFTESNLISDKYVSGQHNSTTTYTKTFDSAKYDEIKEYIEAHENEFILEQN